MEKILVPSDFSPTAEMALNFARQMARRSDASITLIHALDLPVALEPTLMEPSVVQEIGDQSYHVAENSLKDLCAKYGDEKCHIDYFIQSGSITEVLDEYKSVNNFDLIIMGTHGASGFKEIFIGSNAEKVIRKARVPVYTIPSLQSLDKIHNLLIPIDIDDLSDGFLHSIKELLNFFRAKPYFIHVDTPSGHINEKQFYDELYEILAHREFEDFEIKTDRDYTAESGILKAADELNADMICIATHGKVGLSHLIQGSLAEDIANHSRIPVWTYNLKMEEHFEELNNPAFSL